MRSRTARTTRSNVRVAKKHWGLAGKNRIVLRGTLGEAEILAADQILVGLNRTRQSFNARIRKALGYSGVLPGRGDRLVCLKNDSNLRIFNGGLFLVDDAPAWRVKRPLVKLKVSSEDFPGRQPFIVQVRREFFEGGVEDLDWRDLRHSQQFDYGYALTVHKAQGSQWPHVILYDEAGAFREDWRRWLYTGITRASERITIVT